MKRNAATLFRRLRTLIDSVEMGRDEASVELIGLGESIEGRDMADLISEAGIEGGELRGRQNDRADRRIAQFFDK